MYVQENLLCGYIHTISSSSQLYVWSYTYRKTTVCALRSLVTATTVCQVSTIQELIMAFAQLSWDCKWLK